jgi:hypothetical protein
MGARVCKAPATLRKLLKKGSSFERFFGFIAVLSFGLGAL